MHYFIIGDDSRLKEEHLDLLKQKILPSPDSRKLDCETLYAHKLLPEDLKKMLISLPAVSAKRLVILRNGEKLQQTHKDLLEDFLKSDQKVTVLVLEAAWDGREKFVQALKTAVLIKEFFLPKGENVFAVTRMLMARRHADAVKLLHEILEEGTHPLQIMGGLVWFWGNKARTMVAPEEFKKGLLLLQEADLNIKRSKLPPAFALDILIAKISVLLDRK